MNNPIFYLAIYIAFINLAAFFTIFYDKKMAINSRWRIAEKQIFLICLLGGSVGTYVAMNIFRHKTKKKKFKIGVPILIIINMVAFYYMYEILSYNM